MKPTHDNFLDRIRGRFQGQIQRQIQALVLVLVLVSVLVLVLALVLVLVLVLVVRNFKRPKNREDSSDFDDFWTKSIATTQTFFRKFSRLPKTTSTNERANDERTNEWKKFLPRSP